MKVGDVILDPILPMPLVLLLGLVLLFLTGRIYLRVGTTIGKWRNAFLLLFRVTGIVLVLLLLLQPSREELLPPPTKERITLVGVDTSLSMKQEDAGHASRLDAARNLLLETKAVAQNGIPENPRLRVYQFGADAEPAPKTVLALAPTDKTTRFNKSVLSILNTVTSGETANALILLTDGHDFELVNPATTGAAARSRQVPIYALPLGRQGKVRDVSVRITGVQPYCYVKQKSRIDAALWLIGCEYETLSVQLLREGTVVQSRRLNVDELRELPLEFEVIEPEVGQYEYEVQAQPVEGEVETANNSALTYLNVIDQQIQVLILEGDPYWDTTFLQRSLMRNDKFNVDLLVRYGNDKIRALRKTETKEPLRTPETLDQFCHYDIIILGRQVDRILGGPQVALLDRYVKERNGTVIFGRGRAFGQSGPASELEPVLWSGRVGGQVHVQLTSEGRALSGLRGVNNTGQGLDALPDLLGGFLATETRPLTATRAVGASREGSASTPALVHRRYGFGQVVSVGVEGLWRWGLNAKVEGVNTAFDRFWDQLGLWLLAGRDFIPNRQFSFRPNSANILLGEKVHFRTTMRQWNPNVRSVPLTVYLGDSEVGRLNMDATPGNAGRLTAEFLPEKVGRYRAVAKFPDGTTQESRFIVFTENLEEVEVATDVGYLRRLCESSGGRVIEPGELGKLLTELSSEKVEVAPRTRLQPVWNAPWVFYLAGGLFGLDWFLRRRWGLC